jgi:hypothetical protein
MGFGVALLKLPKRLGLDEVSKPAAAITDPK